MTGTYTPSAFECIEAEDFTYDVAGNSGQTWSINNQIPLFSGSGYIETLGNSNGIIPDAAIAYVQNYTPPNTPSHVWFRLAGVGTFSVDYANDNNIEVINVVAGWTWVKANNQLTSQSQIQLIGKELGVFIDKIIITQAVETPSGDEGFVDVDPNTGGGGTGTGTGAGSGGSTTTGDCSGTGTLSCFRTHQAESAFWLQAGSDGNWSTINDPSVSNSEYIQSPSVAASSAPVIAHLSINPVITANWRLWIRAMGSGNLFHTNADDDANAMQVFVNDTNNWAWYLSPLSVDPNSSKVKISTFAANMKVDLIALVDSTDAPSSIDGFCLSNGSGSGGGNGGTNPGTTNPAGGSEDDINSDNHLWLPENLECRINVIPHELTNK